MRQRHTSHFYRYIVPIVAFLSGGIRDFSFSQSTTCLGLPNRKNRICRINKVGRMDRIKIMYPAYPAPDPPAKRIL